MQAMQAATPVPAAPTAAGAPDQSASETRERVPAWLTCALGVVGLVAVTVAVLGISGGAAGAPSVYVPARAGGWPSWLAGPMSGLGLSISSGSFQTLTLVMCAGYALVLIAATTLPGRAIWAAILIAHVILFLGPPLLSQDVFGYLTFARMGALHSLDPYTQIPSEAASDAVYPFIGWPFLHSPYGPLFTLASYGTVPLGAAGGLWALKATMTLASLGAIALIARAARLMGHSARWATAFVGLNPVLLVLAVGGAHNDTLVMLAMAAALALTAGASPRPRAGAAALAAGVGVKLTAGLVLPFLILGTRGRQRLGAALAGVLTLVALAALGLIGFGSHAFGFLDALGEQQQLVATHSVPAETARLFGLSGTPSWWRHAFIAGFALVLVIGLWRTARGADWRAWAGWSTLALVIATAWLLPWYAVWLLPLAAVSGSRPLRAATLVFCVWALLIHLPLAEPLLSPAAAKHHRYRGLVVPAARDRLELTGFQVLRHIQVDLRW